MEVVTICSPAIGVQRAEVPHERSIHNDDSQDEPLYDARRTPEGTEPSQQHDNSVING